MYYHLLLFFVVLAECLSLVIDFRMRVSVMDNPAGYVCRIRSTPYYEISTIPSMLPCGLIPILQLTLKSKVNTYYIYVSLLASLII